jgi:glutamate synthase (ferredoxin)
MTRSDFSTLAWPRERDACGVGFVADTLGRKTHRTLEQALGALCNLSHRGAVSSDGLTGDGAGVLTQIPHKLFRRELARQGIVLERDKDLAVGVVFLANDAPVNEMSGVIEETIAASGLPLLAWREVPIDIEALGEVARGRCPIIRQVLLGRPAGLDDDAFERRLYLTRKRIEARLLEANLGRFYLPSFSHRTVSYKGLMVAPQLSHFYSDLADKDFETAVAVFHQRYSTNTFPTWSLAQPFRFLAHNGEINTLQGNVNFMRAREPVLRSALWGEDVKDLLPVILPGGSDSAALDNAFELLVLSGRDPLHAMMMLVPEAYEEAKDMDPELRAFYDYHATLMEPWDGPAALAFTDGRYAVAALDRNGLRPQRTYVGADGTVVVSSEAGVVPLPEGEIVEKGRLGPGMMIAVDTLEGRLLHDDEIKSRYARRRPYHVWLRHYMRTPAGVHEAEEAKRLWDPAALTQGQIMFGYGSEDHDKIFAPMIFDGEMPVGSMGDDTPLALFSEQPQGLYRYFKQRFAQVTNPPIDPLRERLVMSLETVLGPRGPLLEEHEMTAKVMKFASPLLDESEMAWLRAQEDAFRAKTLSAVFPLADGPEGLERAVERLRAEAEAALDEGYDVLILSDRAAGAELVPVPMLLATAAVHHHLIHIGKRTRTGLVLETGEPREDHHYACLIGYGAALVHPYLALATTRDLAAKAGYDAEKAIKNYRKAVEKGLLKIMSKMGISAISSYRGAQIFEAIGLDGELVERYFTGTPTRIGGATLEAIAADALRFHAEAHGEDPNLRDRGIYRFRKAGEYHAFNPLVFKALHKAVRTESFEAYESYANLVDERSPCTLRDLLAYKKAIAPLRLDEIEPVESIVTRFTTQAMSHGAVSREAHETLAIAMNRLGAKSNSGEGGEDPGRYRAYERDMPELSHAPWHPAAGDWGNSAIKQVASGRFGVTPDYLVSARELEIKMAQGSKPGEGGQIPGHKVNEEIARIRGSVPGVTLISPPPHHDIYSIEDLAQLIYDLKRVNRLARVGVKLVATAGVGTIAAGVAKGYADNIQISGYDGGTGASPLASIKHAGVPWELGLAETQRVLVENNLRGRVTLRVDGGMKTGRDVIIGALLGAEEYGFGTAALVAAGCAMIRQCHLNTCPVGVATQREELRAKFPGTPEHVVNFMAYVAQQVRMILAEMGFRRLDEIVGRVELLEPREVVLPRATRLDLAALLDDPDPGGLKPRRSQQNRNDRPEESAPLDEIVWRECEGAIHSQRPLKKRYAMTNRERTVGARLAGEVARIAGPEGLPPGTLQLSFRGSAGQSFGAFCNAGMTLRLEGEAQDYVGKGMHGGEIAIFAPEGSHFKAHDNVIMGNTVMYGATGGSLYAAGQAGERLGVRNSGGRIIVEGCGDHGCEYMTGGVVVVLGKTGRNFGAGMSGGIAYVLDLEKTFEGRYNPGMVSLERALEGIDEALLRTMIERHHELTGSARAAWILEHWQEVLPRFWKVVPHPGVEDETAQEQDTKAFEAAVLAELQSEAERRVGVEAF